MVATAFSSCGWLYPSYGCGKDALESRWTSLRPSRRLFHFAAARRFGQRRVSAEVMPQIAGLKRFLTTPTYRLSPSQARAVLVGFGSTGFEPVRRSVVSTGVFSGDSMPGEMLVHATETAVATSTLVLGCLLSMMGTQSQARRKAASGDAAVQRSPQPRTLFPVRMTGRAAAAALLGLRGSSVDGNSNTNNTGSSDDASTCTSSTSMSDGAGGSSKCSSTRDRTDESNREDLSGASRQAVAAELARISPGELDVYDESSRCSGGQSLYGSGGGSDEFFGRDGLDGRRGNRVSRGDGGHGGYGSCSGGNGRSGRGSDGGGSGGCRGGHGRGFGPDETGDGRDASSGGLFMGMCLAVAAAVALLARQVKHKPVCSHNLALCSRQPAALQSLHLPNQIRKLPGPTDADCLAKEQQWNMEQRECHGQDQGQQQQEQQQEQEDAAIRPEVAEAVTGSVALAVATAAAAATVVAVASGSGRRIRCPDTTDGGPIRSHSIGLDASISTAAAAMSMSGPWRRALQPDRRAALPTTGPQATPAHPAASSHHPPRQQHGIARHMHGAYAGGSGRDGASSSNSIRTLALAAGWEQQGEQLPIVAAFHELRSSPWGGNVGSSHAKDENGLGCGSGCGFEAGVPRAARKCLAPGQRGAACDTGTASLERRAGRAQQPGAPSYKCSSAPSPWGAAPSAATPTPAPMSAWAPPMRTSVSAPAVPSASAVPISGSAYADPPLASVSAMSPPALARTAASLALAPGARLPAVVSTVLAPALASARDTPASWPRNAAYTDQGQNVAVGSTAHSGGATVPAPDAASAAWAPHAAEAGRGGAGISMAAGALLRRTALVPTRGGALRPWNPPPAAATGAGPERGPSNPAADAATRHVAPAPFLPSAPAATKPPRARGGLDTDWGSAGAYAVVSVAPRRAAPAPAPACGPGSSVGAALPLPSLRSSCNDADLDWDSTHAYAAVQAMPRRAALTPAPAAAAAAAQSYCAAEALGRKAADAYTFAADAAARRLASPASIPEPPTLAARLPRSTDASQVTDSVRDDCSPCARYSNLGLAVSLCDEIAALGAVRSRLEEAQRRADRWLSAAPPAKAS